MITFWKKTLLISPLLTDSWFYSSPVVLLSRKQSIEINWIARSETGIAILNNDKTIGGQSKLKEAVIVKSWKWLNTIRINSGRKFFFSVFLVKLDLIRIISIAKRIRNKTMSLKIFAIIEGQRLQVEVIPPVRDLPFVQEEQRIP